MRRTLSALAVLATLGLGVIGMTGTASAAGAAGAGIAQPATSATTDVQKVDHRWDHSRRYDRRYDRRWDRRGPPRHWGGPRSGVYFEFGTAPRVYRAPPRRAYGGGMSRAHVNWCYSQYRSYDVNTNTFQPYNGPRRACYSPYS
jgi:hypothetical protein